MRITIPHDLGRDEVRRRIRARTGEAGAKAEALLGGPMTLDLVWLDDDHLRVEASAMGFSVPSSLTIEDEALVFEVEIPAGLGFARKMIEGTIREKGEKLLA